MRIVSETEFHARLLEILASLDAGGIGSVTGPGRSGAIASVYTSHKLGVPFIPFGSRCPVHLGRLLLIDTARESGATLRKAERRYAYANPRVVACFEEPPRVAFWYEAAKPQHYRHERAAHGDPFGPGSTRCRLRSREASPPCRVTIPIASGPLRARDSSTGFRCETASRGRPFRTHPPFDSLLPARELRSPLRQRFRTGKPPEPR